jgi:hypothetical protein
MSKQAEIMSHHRSDREVKRRRLVGERCEIDRHDRLLAGRAEAMGREPLAQIRRLRRRADPPQRRYGTLREVATIRFDRRIDLCGR